MTRLVTKNVPLTPMENFMSVIGHCGVRESAFTHCFKVCPRDWKPILDSLTYIQTRVDFKVRQTHLSGCSSTYEMEKCSDL